VPAGLKLPPNVRALGVVSLLTDVSSEMIYPLLPRFVTGALHAGPVALGAIEGAAEATASLLKLGSGWLSDRMDRRKPLVVLGYAIAAAARPFMAVVATVAQVLAVRVTDRFGKGLRTSPRDALLADSVDPSVRGRAFGFHRAADHLGAVIGPLVAWALLTWGGFELRTVFLVAAVPGTLAVFVLLTRVREVPRRADADGGVASGLLAPSPPAASVPSAGLGGHFWAYLAVLGLFTLGNCSDAFLLLRAGDLGVPEAAVPLLWSAHHVVKALSSTPAGSLSDRVGRRPLLVAGWLWFAAAYLGFALATAAWHAWALFLAYGLFFGLVEGAEKALVADLAPPSRRGAAFGWFHGVVGVATLPASILFGVLWREFGPRTAFTFGAGVALVAAVLLALVVRAPRPAGIAR
jgi:MFS family permease